MRILHTSDWHLGIRHGTLSRGPDHDRFLAWLNQTLAHHAIDVLVVAGDVFDTMTPSADALNRYYRFLADVRDTGVAQVVIVGGNHDSASRLNAPEAVLDALGVHVVGGIDGTAASQERCIVPLVDRSGAVAAVCIALPFVHEFKLGVRTTDLDQDAMRAEFRTEFTALYQRLTDQARARFPDLPIVATGHLTLGPAKGEDYPREIHQVGNIDGLPASVLDPRIQYTALGHIHRSYPVNPTKTAWYSGSPVAFSLPEAKTVRRVLMVDLDADPAGLPTVHKLDIPSPRGLLELRDTPDGLVDAVSRLQWSEPLPPLLFLRAQCDLLPSDCRDRLHHALSTHPEGARPMIVELRIERVTPMTEADTGPRPSLAELTVGDVFAQLLAQRGDAGDEAVTAAFAGLASATEDDFDAMVANAMGESR